MGGLIAIKLQEQHPDLFDGVLTLCGVAGGTRQLFDYYAHARALFDLLYPGTLPGDAGGVSAGITSNRHPGASRGCHRRKPRRRLDDCAGRSDADTICESVRAGDVDLTALGRTRIRSTIS